MENKFLVLIYTKISVPTQIILIFGFSKSICIISSCPIGISAGNSNQTCFRFRSSVSDTTIIRGTNLKFLKMLICNSCQGPSRSNHQSQWGLLADMSSSQGISLFLLLFSCHLQSGISFRNEAHDVFDKFIKDVLKAQKTDQCDLNYVADHARSKISQSLADLSLGRRYHNMVEMHL